MMLRTCAMGSATPKNKFPRILCSALLQFTKAHHTTEAWMTTKNCVAMHSELCLTHMKLALHLGTLAYIHKASPVAMHSGFWLMHINLALHTLI